MFNYLNRIHSSSQIQTHSQITLLSFTVKAILYHSCKHFLLFAPFFLLFTLRIKRHLLLRRKAMTDLDNILKSRGITLPTKILVVKAIVFAVVMYGCEVGP